MLELVGSNGGGGLAQTRAVTLDLVSDQLRYLY